MVNKRYVWKSKTIPGDNSWNTAEISKHHFFRALTVWNYFLLRKTIIKVFILWNWIASPNSVMVLLDSYSQSRAICVIWSKRNKAACSRPGSNAGWLSFISVFQMVSFWLTWMQRWGNTISSKCRNWSYTSTSTLTKVKVMRKNELACWFSFSNYIICIFSNGLRRNLLHNCWHFSISNVPN